MRRNFFLYAILVIFLIGYTSCEKYPEAVLDNKPSVSVTSATDITFNSVVLHGNLSTSSLEAASSVGFIYHKEGGVEKRVFTSPKNGEITCELDSLERNTTYYYSMFANGGGNSEFISNESSFKTYAYTLEDHVGSWMYYEGDFIDEISYDSKGLCIVRQYLRQGYFVNMFYGPTAIDKDIITSNVSVFGTEENYEMSFKTESIDEFQWQLYNVEDPSTKYTYTRVVETIDVKIGEVANSWWIIQHPDITSVETLNKDIADVDEDGNVIGESSGITYLIVKLQDQIVMLKVIVTSNDFIRDYTCNIGLSYNQLLRKYGEPTLSVTTPEQKILHQYINPLNDPMVLTHGYYVNSENVVDQVMVMLAAENSYQKTKIKTYLKNNYELLSKTDLGVEYYKKDDLCIALQYHEAFASLIFWIDGNLKPVPEVKSIERITISDAVAWNIADYNNVASFRTALLKEEDRLNKTYEEIFEYVENNSKLFSIEGGYIYRNYLLPDTQYQLFIIAYGEDDRAGMMTEFSIHTKPSTNQSYAELSDWRYIEDRWKIDLNLVNSKKGYYLYYYGDEELNIKNPIQYAFSIYNQYWSGTSKYTEKNTTLSVVSPESRKQLLVTWTENLDGSMSGILNMKTNYSNETQTRSLIPMANALIDDQVHQCSWSDIEDFISIYVVE